MTKRNFPARTRIEMFWLDANSSSGWFGEKEFEKLKKEGAVSTVSYVHHVDDEGIYLARDWSSGDEPYGDIKFCSWGTISKIVIWKPGGKK
jgi:hypothetical protein